MENKDKKKKLTLSISGSVKKPIAKIEIAKNQNKNSVIVDKKNTKFVRPKSGQFQERTKSHPSSNTTKSRPFSPTNDFEKRKLAEQRATRRLKGEAPNDKDFKNKALGKKREYKLTLSRALNEDESEFKARSLASIKRAKQKENRLTNGNKTEVNLKPIQRNVNIPEVIIIRELANRMAEQSSNLIKHLFGMGVTATINHTIDADTAEYLVKEFGHVAVREKKIDIEVNKISSSENKNLKKRPPIVTVMGHVDHGKTSLLDALRSADVVSGEFGGITQHIGAYQVNINNEKITFIDTPGHAAFTEMRARGSKLTDIVVLVVAADDGVKPQTIESIKHAKAAKVPIVVAINKCDLPEADPQKIKNQLLEYELIAEELSGDTLFIEISAVTKKNLDKLKENILLQAELLDLKAEEDNEANGIILESKIETGRGPIATVIVTSGSLKKGDFFVSGKNWGKARALINDKGENVEIAKPSTPIELLGMNKVAKAGDDFIVVESEKKAKEINNFRNDNSKSNLNPLTFATQESAFLDKTAKELNIIIKSDVHGSSEAIKGAILNIKHEEVKAKIIHSEVGMITETDVSLARASDAILIAFNIKPSKEAKKLAEQHKLKIESFNIIYQVIDFIKGKMSGLLNPDIEETIVGSAEILEIFKVSKVGKVAGSKVINGEINQDNNARLIRDGSIVYNGKILSIFREKNQTKKVSEGLECGITLKDFSDFKAKDIIEVYNSVTTERRV
jgi:translation initiation factor IF-2|tara:strand:- start:1859 stop:4069 length:2211 start_codon:yes stop_codon:yes gene_type:complete